MGPMLNEWNTDITLGSFEDLPPISYDKRTEKMLLHEIAKENGDALLLNWPLKLKIEYADDLVLIDHDDLNLYSYGGSKEEALSNFYDCFLHFLDFYCSDTNAKFSPSALRLKALFGNIVKETLDAS